MPQVEVFEGEQEAPTFTAEFEFLPRVGEYLSKLTDDYFEYYNVVEVWHRQDTAAERFKACLRVQRDD
jgi:hypothetical protein